MGIFFKSFWFNRFQILRIKGNYYFQDILIPNIITQPTYLFRDAKTIQERNILFFIRGFMKNYLDLSPLHISNSLEKKSNIMFWQFPCRTEAVAFENHKNTIFPPTYKNNEIHIYLGLPWATWIDKKELTPKELLIPRVRLSGYIHVLKELGLTLRIHTVCQHIYWRKLLPIWQSLGVTDLWLSHKTAAIAENDKNLPFKFHPWQLYAVNVEDSKRNSGIIIGKDPANKRYLASFIGAHMQHYLSDVRLQLQQFIKEPDFFIQIKHKWHFEDIVYQHQVKQVSLAKTYTIDGSVEHYNHILSESVFSLCPSGAGANTLRFWESLAVGSIPVLMGVLPELPKGGSLENIDWSSIVIYIDDQQISSLAKMLRSISLEERRKRQALALATYSKVKTQRCF